MFSYGWEKLQRAVSCLAGRGDQRERLVDAVVSSLIRISPDRDLPPEIRSDFAQFIGDITSVKAERDEGNIQATIDSLDEMGVHRAVEKIIGFYDTVCRHQEPH